MDRARLDQCDKVVKKIDQRTNRIGFWQNNMPILTFVFQSPPLRKAVNRWA